MASTKLTRTLSGNGNQNTATWSFWVKRSGLTDGRIYNSWYDGNNQFWIMFSSNKFNVKLYQSSSYSVQVETNRLFRDTSGFYHIVVAIDTTQGTASDRVKIYVNGSQETSLNATTYPSQNQSMPFGLASYNQRIGFRDAEEFLDGSMSHFYFIDGTAYTASTFGSTDSTTGEWKINTSPSVTMGTNGFLILKDGNTVTDQSSNSNDWTVAAGTLTNTEDCPSDVFATLNPLHKGNTLTGITYSNGNNTFTAGSTAYPYTFSTLANSSGKYYAEFKATSGANNTFIGISAGVKAVYLGHNLYDYSYVGSNGQIYTNQASTNYGSALSTNDILGVAMDLDNNKLYFSINGTWQNSANPSSGTGGHTIVAPSSTTTGVYHFAVGDSDQLTPQIQCNFGNGYFGTTAISSEGTNASGIGKFEYDVPTGYTALSTKGLNE